MDVRAADCGVIDVSSDDIEREDEGRADNRGAEGAGDDAGWDERRRSRYENSYTYMEARKESKVPVVIGIVSVVVIVFGAILMVGGDLRAYIQLPSTQSSDDGGETQVSQAAAGGSEAPTSVTMDITMAGDVYLRYAAFQSGQDGSGGYDYTHLFSNVSDELSGSDVTLLNQEGSLAGTDYGVIATQGQVNSPQELGEAEASAGFDAIVRANDHALDEGTDGLTSELAFWKGEDGVTVLGVADPSDGSASPNAAYTYEKDGFKVAVLAYTTTAAGGDDDSQYVSVYDESQAQSDIQAARDDGADMVIVCMHWGQAYDSDVTDEQREDAQALANAGADVIFGTHPHVLQPIETLSGDDGHTTLCYWSLGSLINSGMDAIGYVGGIAKVELTKDSDGTCSVSSASLVPTVIHEGTTSDTMSVYPAASYTDELASTNAYTTVTPDYVSDQLQTLFGDAYDSSSQTVSVSL